jgi:hypothetical protein
VPAVAQPAVAAAYVLLHLLKVRSLGYLMLFHSLQAPLLQAAIPEAAHGIVAVVTTRRLEARNDKR